jgi:hypothetical protein
VSWSSSSISLHGCAQATNSATDINSADADVAVWIDPFILQHTGRDTGCLEICWMGIKDKIHLTKPPRQCMAQKGPHKRSCHDST